METSGKVRGKKEEGKKVAWIQIMKGFEGSGKDFKVLGDDEMTLEIHNQKSCLNRS